MNRKQVEIILIGLRSIVTILSRFYSIIAGPQIFSILTYIIYIILGSLMIE